MRKGTDCSSGATSVTDNAFGMERSRAIEAGRKNIIRKRAKVENAKRKDVRAETGQLGI